jgi:hypothetical protein
MQLYAIVCAVCAAYEFLSTVFLPGIIFPGEIACSQAADQAQGGEYAFHGDFTASFAQGG